MKRRTGGRGGRNSQRRKIGVRKVETEEERKIMVETETYKRRMGRVRMEERSGRRKMERLRRGMRKQAKGRGWGWDRNGEEEEVGKQGEKEREEEEERK